jgi:hypothetical protein
MNKDAVKELQRSLNIIRKTTNKENYATQVKVLELMAQAILSHIQALDTTPLMKNVKKVKIRKSNLAAPLPKPKSLKSPPPTNNPNDTVPALPQSMFRNHENIKNV